MTCLTDACFLFLNVCVKEEGEGGQVVLFFYVLKVSNFFAPCGPFAGFVLSSRIFISAENIKAALLAALLEIGITEEEVTSMTFVSDNGSNIVKALKDFNRIYCFCHALSLCTKYGLTVKYHELISKCLDASPSAEKLVKSCDDAVRFIKNLKGRDPILADLKESLWLSKKQHSSYSNMLQSLRARFDDVSNIIGFCGSHSAIF